MREHARLAELLEAPRRLDRIAAAGLTGSAALRADDRLRRCAEALTRLGGSEHSRACAFAVPGRIEVLGKHTDYAGGRSILAAAEQGFIVVGVRRDDRAVQVLDVQCEQFVRFELGADLEPGIGWTNYPMTAARRIARNFSSVCVGADIALISDLPQAAGLSSSSAFIVSSFLALGAVNALADDADYRTAIASPEDLASYLAAVENGQSFRSLAGDRGVGTQGGSEDHTAMLCSRPGQLAQYAFAPVRFERLLPLPSSHLFVIGASGVRAEKSAAARDRYNRTAMLMKSAAEHWRLATGDDTTTIGALIERDPGAADRLRAILSQARDPRYGSADLLARVEHFIIESQQIVPAAGDALLKGDLGAFGMLTDRSQRESERLLGNQIEETVHLARSARSLGAVAASAFGAGFGGSVWALADRADAERFERAWRASYLKRFPQRADDAVFFQTAAGGPMVRFL